MKTSSPSKLEFMPLLEANLEEILAIELEAYPEPWTVGMFREEMGSPRSYFRVAFSGGTLVGYSGIWLAADEAHVTSVTVALSHRGNGYGREQLIHLLEVAVRKGAVAATLEVRESNDEARRLYVSEGFRAVGRRKGYYSKTKEDAVIMTKDLV